MIAHCVRDFMTPDPVACTPDTLLYDVARLMADNDCGAIPVVEDWQSLRPIGIITDRDLACRALARAQDPLTILASECMSSPVVSIAPEASLQDCCRLMEEQRVRRLLVVDESGRCCGIVVQGDIAQIASDAAIAVLLRRISYPPKTPSRAEALA